VQSKENSGTHEDARHPEEAVAVFGVSTGIKQFLGKCEHVKHSIETKYEYDTRYEGGAVTLSRAQTGVKQFLKKCERVKHN
jgi:hypothetical protein